MSKIARMVTPPYLQKGDTVGVIAPARKVDAEGLKESLLKLESWGLKVKTGKYLYGVSNQFSGTDEDRISDIQQMLDDENVKAIICARGGYGTLRLIDKLNFDRFAKSPKWIVGYSDICVLHSHVHQCLGIESLHATMPVNYRLDESSTESLKSALFGDKISYSWESHNLNRTGKCTGVITGGNLSILYALQGSASDITTEGKILFIEDLDEYLYHIDRMMISLKRSGKLKSLAGLLVGSFTEVKDNEIPFGKSAEEIILDAVKEYNYPVAFGFPAGHGQKNSAFPLGRKAELIVGENSSVYF